MGSTAPVASLERMVLLFAIPLRKKMEATTSHAADVDFYDFGDDAPSYMVWRNAQVSVVLSRTYQTDGRAVATCRFCAKAFQRHLGSSLHLVSPQHLYLCMLKILCRNGGSTNFPNLLVEMRPHRPELACVVCQTRPDIWLQVKQCAACRCVSCKSLSICLCPF